ncbi:hypothetical protein NC652_018122 [Populus alba x Populus x berolinensis]|nr:hypothetical protein NC652_018122 [Populus alba x Populus x berolinensis]
MSSIDVIPRICNLERGRVHEEGTGDVIFIICCNGDYNMVKNLHKRLWPDSSGAISLALQEEADHLLMEAALNDGQVLQTTVLLLMWLWKISQMFPNSTTLGCYAHRGLVGIHQFHIQSLSASSDHHVNLSDNLEFNLSVQVSPSEPIESIMMPLKAAKPLLGTLHLKKVVMRFFWDQVVPIVDDWGSCVGLLHREDCTELNAPLMTMMRSPPPCVTTTTSIGHVVDLI